MEALNTPIRLSGLRELEASLSTEGAAAASRANQTGRRVPGRIPLSPCMPRSHEDRKARRTSFARVNNMPLGWLSYLKTCPPFALLVSYIHLSGPFIAFNIYYSGPPVSIHHHVTLLEGANSVPRTGVQISMRCPKPAAKSRVPQRQSCRPPRRQQS